MKRFLVLFCLVFISQYSFSDGIRYNKKVNINIESDNYIINHYHDWTWQNTSGYIECIDKLTNESIFHVTSPALTKLFISDDEKYIVGLSNIKVDNPYHAVILDISGKYILQKHVSKIGVKNYRQSITNYVFWYNENDPGLEYVYINNKFAGIRLYDEDNKKIIILMDVYEKNIRLVLLIIGTLIVVCLSIGITTRIRSKKRLDVLSKTC